MIPTIKHILYATDLSQPAKKAFGVAMSMVEKYGAKLTIVHVLPEMDRDFMQHSGLEIGALYDDDTWKTMREAGMKRAEETMRKRIKEVCDEFAGEGAACPISDADIKVVRGHAVNTIVDYARDVDHVVMGTHGHGRLGGLLIGSVAQGVISKCTTPVTIVRLDE